MSKLSSKPDVDLINELEKRGYQITKKEIFNPFKHIPVYVYVESLLKSTTIIHFNFIKDLPLTISFYDDDGKPFECEVKTLYTEHGQIYISATSITDKIEHNNSFLNGLSFEDMAKVSNYLTKNKLN